jgi:hypothetical protein
MGSPNPSPCFILSLPHHTLENKSKQRSTWEKKEFNQIPFERDPPGESGFILGTFLAQAPQNSFHPEDPFQRKSCCLQMFSPGSPKVLVGFSHV